MSPFQDRDRLPESQRSIRARCVHPTGPFVPFEEDSLQGTIVSRFEAQVKAGPDRLAIRSPTSELTYREVDALATRLAATLLGRRGDIEEPVALVFEHDGPLFAAMLGVLRAGKFYVPLDPSYPSERLRYMLDDAHAAVVVSSHECRPVARELAGVERDVVCLDALDVVVDAEAVTRPIAPEQSALLLYTSGSTGRPKGFVHTHRNVLLDVMNYTNTVHYSAADRFLLVSSCAFADSIRTIYGSLLNGASLLPFDLKRYGIQELSGWLTSQQITIYRSVPTVFRHFVRTLSGAETFDDLRLIVLGGEPVLRRDVELYQRHFPETCILVNRIGTGEALTYGCYFVDQHTTVDGTKVPVGYPFPGKEILLLDGSGREIDGPGVGELVVRSRFMSPGYWRRPDLTAAAFSSVPGESGLRVYRTGDRCERLSDGCLVHLGRQDFQVKIRGHRIETAEIDMALAEHPAIADAVVVARPDDDGELRLVAYVVLATSSALTRADLRRFLATRLPDPMLPSAYEVLESLPFTTSGKVDRRALPAPGTHTLEGDVEPEAAPETPVETALAGIWCEVLCLERVGRDQHFLDLGGDSLRAMRVIVRVRSTFGVALSVRDLLGAATVAEMARVVADRART